MTIRRRRRLTRRQRGMTLIEIIVVVAILTLMAAAVAVSVLAVHRSAQVDVARLDLKALRNALDLYALKNGRYPPTLAALVDTRILSHAPKDPWKRDYTYKLEAGQPVLQSYGRDGEPGGDGDDADIVSGEP